MRHVVRRLGFRVSRGWALLIVATGALTAGAFWIGPFRPLPPDLRLLALGGDGQFGAAIGVPETKADTTPPQPDVPARFPIVLATHNQGARGAQPVRLALNVPGRFRISNSEGMAYPGRITQGNPLVRYVFDLKTGRIEPGQMPRVLSNLDTLWLEPVIPSYYCIMQPDSVPDFVVAPRHDPNEFAQLQIYYSFDARLRDRQTGLLTVQLPPRLLDRPAPPEPPVMASTIYSPAAPAPPTGRLRKIGLRSSYCGEGSALQIHSMLWQNAAGGRLFVVGHGPQPRKRLYDLDRDSIIELETWDSDGDGVFEGSRPARMVIPEFLLPPRPVAIKRDTIAGDSLRADSTGLPPDSGGVAAAPADAFKFPAAVFHNTEGGPFRFWRAQQRARGLTTDTVRPASRPQPRDTTPPRTLGVPVPQPARDTVRRDTIRSDTLRRDTTSVRLLPY